MKKRLKYIASITTVVVFLLSTSGFTIYSHHCSIKGSSYSVSTSYTLSDCNTCGDEIQPSKPVASCCSAKQKCSTESNTNNCCSDEKQFVKIEVDYNIPAEIDHLQPIIIDIFELSLMVYDINNLIINHEKNSNYSLPPPKTGNDIIVFLSRQKTDPSPIA